ncbi:unnamed protein product [Leptosia nina]|uniref:C2H2-type domain-containing protein n=1 Tax=Leptosia nina TaxID=320188 RepID=A0AAV1JGW6_9NEOP
MYKIEVDPKLFITCRLCLDEMGQYQIVPRVKEQIKFCFDFDVDPFDGLPQLICKKCETILSQFNDIKKKFVEKQNNLKKGTNTSKLLDNNEVSTSSQQDTVSSTQTTVFESNTKKKQFCLSLKRTQGTSLQETDSYVVSNKKVKGPKQGWRLDYYKYFACKICSNSFRHRKKLNKHMQIHNSLLEKFSYVFNKDCKIYLPKIDEKTNFTGMNDMIVLDKEKILHSGNAEYNIFYTHRSIKLSDNEKTSMPESSDEDIITFRKRKRLRLLSKNSDETVFVECAENTLKMEKEGAEADQENREIECVDIDSSSEAETEKIETKPKVTDVDFNKKTIIAQLVSSCAKKYEPKDGNLTVNKQSQLQHKILSMGRKIVNKKTFNCTGLLRYLENKDLDVVWNPKSERNIESDFVRIRTLLRGNTKEDSENGWECLSTQLKIPKTSTSNIDLLSEGHNVDNFAKAAAEPAVETRQIDVAECIPISSTKENTNLNKLLNQNPVAHPKQIPRKTNSKLNVTADRKTLPSSTTNSEQNMQELQMPIITGTVSLATDNVSSNSNIKNAAKEAEVTVAFVPRIKVKPVSQLMPDKHTTSSAVVGIPQTPSWNLPVSPGKNTSVSCGKIIIQDSDWVIMHTVELPNTRTRSPFKYFQNLLHIHNIILLDTTDTITADFACLIKFKSIFKQESKSITLCLSLYSNVKQFYVKVTDTTTPIDIVSLMPTWQWEILQLYNSDIINNLLENAKKISQKMYDSTNYFMSLLRSIVFRREK